MDSLEEFITMRMRKSNVLKKLRAGEIVNCLKINSKDGRIAEIAALCGTDCIWLDMEHCPDDWSVIEEQIWAAKAYDVDTVVRISRGGYSDYIRPLELDASGIMVPHIMSFEDAKNIVRMTRFHPVGRRPVDGGNADGAYCMIDFNEYLTQANNERFVIIQIEDPEPMNEIDEIASLDGIDMLFFGPADFSHGIGAPGKWDHPELIKARIQIAEVAGKHGKFAGTACPLEACAEMIDIGYRFLSIGADVIGLSDYFNKILKSFQKFCK